MRKKLSGFNPEMSLCQAVVTIIVRKVAPLPFINHGQDELIGAQLNPRISSSQYVVRRMASYGAFLNQMRRFFTRGTGFFTANAALASEERLDPIRLCLLDEAVHPHGRGGHSAHRDLERRDSERVFQLDLIGDARQPGAESQVAGEGFGAMPKSTFESCSQRSSLAGSPGSSTISSA